MSISFIQHQGKKILYTDLSGKSKEEAFEIMKQASQIVRNSPPKSVLSMLNVEGMRFNKSFLDDLQNMAKQNEPYILGTAVFGLSSITKLISKAVIQFTGRQTGLYDTKEECMEWLVNIP